MTVTGITPGCEPKNGAEPGLAGMDAKLAHVGGSYISSNE
jgi:hypothetical protein